MTVGVEAQSVRKADRSVLAPPGNRTRAAPIGAGAESRGSLDFLG
jgi:hypothetical protein